MQKHAKTCHSSFEEPGKLKGTLKGTLKGKLKALSFWPQCAWQVTVFFCRSCIRKMLLNRIFCDPWNAFECSWS